MSEENESEINEIEYLSTSEVASEEDDIIENEDYNILNENNSSDEEEESGVMQVDEEIK
jgi:hypothetical protein